MEMTSAVGSALIHSMAFLASSVRIASFVRHSCAPLLTRWPLISLYHSGCAPKYLAAGRSG